MVFTTKLMGLKMRFATTVFLLVGLLVLNLLDAIFTVYEFDVGLAKWEVNPLARFFLNLGNGWFIFWKVLHVGLCALIFWKWHNHKLAKFGMVGCFIIYAAVICWHKWGMS